MNQHTHTDQPVSTQCALEQLFPRIVETLCKTWNTADIETYLQGLLIDRRSQRGGFPSEVIEELMLLDGLLWQQSDKRQHFLNTSDDMDFSFNN